ncbi:hypothetical protein ACNOYE_14415 [Nannocystaceae bacterium ST9]
MRAPEDLLDGLPVHREPGVGWAALTDLEFLGELAMVLGLAIGLAALIAYHPTLRGRASTLEEIEQPKTFILYAMIGALIAIIVKVQPSMALVVFGIGGLMRFRTDVGLAKDTGRVILVTVVGLSCGLELYAVALLTTLLAWLLIFVLDGDLFAGRVERMVVQGLEKDAIARTSEVYVAALRELGCTIVGEDKRVKKGSVAILYRAPRGLARARLEARLAEIPEGVRGTVGWETS